MVGLAIPVKGMGGTPIVAYNFGPSATEFTYAATTIATGVTASGIDSTSDFGDADTFTENDGQTSAYYANDPGGGVNMLSVNSNQSSTDDNFWIETIVTAQPGYVIDPTSFELYGGAGGSSATRSAYIYDSADDALDPNITPTAGAPTGTNTVANPLQGSGTFTAVRGTSSNMTEIQASFASDPVNLSSFIVRVYFDTQGNVSKNIDLGYLELDGSVVALPVALTWNNTGGTGDGVMWDTSNQNWNNGTGPATYSDGDSVTFNDTNNNNYGVTLNSTVNPASVVVNNSLGNYTISGTGTIGGTGSLTKMGSSTLTLSTSNTYSGGTNVSAGLLIIAPTSTPATTSALPTGALTITGGEVKLASNVTKGSNSINPPVTKPTSSVNITSLAISGTGALDITNNHIIVDYSGLSSDPIIGSIAAWIASGYASGAWTGVGIDSSTAASNHLSYGIGYAASSDPGNPAGLSSGQIEIKYTLLGDTNLDGKVNGTDFTVLATNFNQSGKAWDQGDFNYDGKVNGSDFLLLAANFNQSAGQSAVAADDLAAVDAFGAANGMSMSLTSVPEPASAGMLVMAGLGILSRRRRSSRRSDPRN
jgi:autotransporter-associated beta strand protein